MSFSILNFKSALCAFTLLAGTASAQTDTLKNYSDPVAPVGNKQLTVPSVVKPILDYFMRDTYITLGPDGFYYMTGTVNTKAEIKADQPKFDNSEKGIYLWRSKDMKKWEPLGCVFSNTKDATWQKTWRPTSGKNWEANLPDSDYRGVWAPEIHYIKSKKQWLIIACVSHGGSYVIRSTSGKPEGPYVNIDGNSKAPIYDEIDGSLFEDDNGAVYVVGHNHAIARMKDDLTGLAEPFKKFIETPYKPEPYLEGVYIVKYNGKYQLMQTAWSFHKPDDTYTYIDKPQWRENRHSYDVVVAEADNIYGPYGPRYTAIQEGGHNNLFVGKDGGWWSTTFFNPRGEMGKIFPVTCRPAVVAVKWVNGKLMPDLDRNLKFYGSK